MKYRWLLLTVFLLGPAGGVAQGRQFYQFGGTGGSAWQESGTLNFVDAHKAPGSIEPLSADPSQDLIPLALTWGGGVLALGSTDGIAGHWATDYKFIIDGDSTTAFIHPPRPNLLGGLGSFFYMDMRFDLGAPFPIQLIRFRTRPSAPEHLIRQYRMWINDGSRETRTSFGDPIWTLLRDEPQNLRPVVEVEVGSRLVRYIRLRPEQGELRRGTDYTWELATLEVYAQGFTPAASFTSTPIDLGAAASLGRIWWHGRQDAQARVLIQTRSGWDEQPEIYWRRTGIGDQEVPYDETGKPLTADTYRQLPPQQKGRITADTDNWSVWQTYEFDHGRQGTRLLSPSPRRYFQVRVDFFSRGMESGRLDSLWFEYSQPPVASEVIGEVYPLIVEPSKTVSFTYFLRARLEPGQRGFDALELRTAAQLDRVLAVYLDQQPVGFTVERLEGTPAGVQVRFPRVTEDQTRIDVEFEAQVFRYGTAFEGMVLDTERDDVPLAVSPGNVVDEVLSDQLTVRTEREKGLLDAVQVFPNPFSPDGDGINDRVKIGYSVLRLTRESLVRTGIYELSGRQVRRFVTKGGSAAYEVEWDGRDERGNLVPPGIYIYRIELETDSGKEERIGTLGVVY